MFTRKDTKIKVSIFDISNMEIYAKKEITEKIMKLYEEGIASITKPKEVTRLIVPFILVKEQSNFSSCGTVVYRMLFNDIMGCGLRIPLSSKELKKQVVNRTIFSEESRVSFNSYYSSTNQEGKIHTEEPSTFDLIN